MGWYYSNGANKKDYIKELIEDGTPNEDGRYSKCIAHSVYGNELYSVRTWFNAEHQEIDINNRAICIDLLTNADGQGYGHKPLSEESGTYAIHCPLKFFKMVPKVMDQEWRDEVIRYKNINKMFVNGDRITFAQLVTLNNGKTVDVAIVEDNKKLIFETPTGMRFRLSKGFLLSTIFTVNQSPWA